MSRGEKQYINNADTLFRKQNCEKDKVEGKTQTSPKVIHRLPQHSPTDFAYEWVF